MRSSHTTAACLCCVAVVAAAATAAPATVGDETEDQVVVVRKPSSGQTAVIEFEDGQMQANGVIKQYLRDQDRTIEVKLQDGEVTVRLDGELLPTDRVERRDGRLRILDEDGNEMESFSMFFTPDGNVIGGFGNRFRFAEEGAPMWRTDPPKVMIGIQMAEPSPALRKHLRLEEGEATMISGIYEDLPAAKAGLELYDVIVAIDGDKPADSESVRAAVAGLEPGEELTLSVIQAGRTKQFTVQAEAFDAERFDPARLSGEQLRERLFIPGGQGFMEIPGPGRFRWNQQELNELLRERLPQLQERFAPLEERQEVDEQMEKLQRRLEQLKDMLDDLIRQAEEN